MKAITKKWIIWLSVSFNVLLVAFFVGKRIYYANSGVHTDQEAQAYYDMWNNGRQSVLGPLPVDTSDIVFIGNSITEGFPLAELFKSYKVKNRGIGGNNSKHILGRIKGIAQGHPKKIFLDVGLNDIRSSMPLDYIFFNYKAILSIIKQESPTTQIYVQSVLPVGQTEKKYEKSIMAFNQIMEKYCQEQHINYLNLYHSFVEDGILKPNLTYDDIHLNGNGYEVWKEEITDFVK